MLDLSIIIVSYNTKDFLRENLTSLENNISKGIKYQVIVVDNASSDGSAQMVEDEFKNVVIIANKDNLGFSKANNMGLRKAGKSRYMLFLNPDTIVGRSVLEHMINFMDMTPDAGASTCKIIMGNGQIDDAAHRGFPTPWNAFTHFSGISKLAPNSRFLNGYNLGWKDLDKTHEIDVLAGAFMLTRFEAGEDANWWDEDYFFYGEDIDFCYMLKQKGWKIYYVPDVSIFHRKGASSGIKKVSADVTTATRETKIRITQSRFNAMKIFYKKHYKNKYPGFVTGLVNLGIDIKLRLALRQI